MQMRRLVRYETGKRRWMADWCCDRRWPNLVTPEELAVVRARRKHCRGALKRWFLYTVVFGSMAIALVAIIHAANSDTLSVTKLFQN
jgi:hypothetical protein